MQQPFSKDLNLIMNFAVYFVILIYHMKLALQVKCLLLDSHNFLKIITNLTDWYLTLNFV